jgi:hypothetical protein
MQYTLYFSKDQVLTVYVGENINLQVFSTFGTIWRRMVNLTPWNALLWEKSPSYPLDTMPGGPQSMSGYNGGEKIAATARNKIPILCLSIPWPFDIQNELTTRDASKYLL